MHALLDDEGGHALGAGRRIGLGVNHQGVGVAAVGDPHLGAVEHVAVAFLVGPQLHAKRRRNRRLARTSPARRRVQPEISLGRYFWRCASVPLRRIWLTHRIRVGTVGQAHRRRSARDFLERDDMRQIAHVGAAIFFRGGHAEQAHVAEFSPQIGGKFVDAVDRRQRAARFPLRQTPARLGARQRYLRPGRSPDWECSLVCLHYFVLCKSYFSALPYMTMMVCCIRAQSFSCPALSAYTSACVTIRVRPGRTTLPRAIS